MQVDEAGVQREFWGRIEQINDISVRTGLERVSGQIGVYERTLKLTIKEIEKCDKNLNEFLASGDMRNFTVKVHSIKSSLANIGAMELSGQARELEFAAIRADAGFCALNLPPFLERLNGLNSKLTEAFTKKSQSYGPIEIPPELPRIFDKMLLAFDEMDFSAINEGIKSLDELDLKGALQEEVEQIKDAVMMMDYDSAAKVMRKLLKC